MIFNIFSKYKIKPFKKPQITKLKFAPCQRPAKDIVKIKLKNNITTVKWDLFIENDTKTMGVVKADEKEVVFMDDKTQEYQELIETQLSVAAKTGTSLVIAMDNEGNIDVDDI